MNKADKKCMALIIIAALLMYLPLIVSDLQNQGKMKEAIVRYRDEEVLRIDLNKDGVYHVNGTLGDVEIEVKDEAIRVEKENSPYNLCSKQGWVKETNRPIICLPNDVVVDLHTLEESSNSDDTVVR